jgi:hypothetical protein
MRLLLPGRCSRLFDADCVLIPRADVDEDICAAIASIELVPDRTFMIDRPKRQGRTVTYPPGLFFHRASRSEP